MHPEKLTGQNKKEQSKPWQKLTAQGYNDRIKT